MLCKVFRYNSFLFHLQGALFLSFLSICQLSHAQSSLNYYTPLTNCPRSQKQANIWYFGNKAGIDFNMSPSVPLTDNDVMISIKSSAVISDSMGNLLFFTDGKKVWNRNFNLMPKAVDLEGDPGVTQPAIVIPAPSSPEKYYLFTIDIMNFNPDNSFTSNGLTYSIIDMNLRNGTGDAGDPVNSSLLNPVCQKLTAVKHRNNKDYWVIVHEWNSARFFVFSVSSGGISSPVISTAGSYVGGGYADQVNAYGYIKASPDGSKLAQAISGENKIELFDFDNSTGIISNPLTYSSTDPGISPYGIEFSSDSKKLYASLLQLTGDGPPSFPSRIYQFDMKTGLNNPVLIDTIPGFRIGGMQLGTDGRIYVSRTVNITSTSDSLDVIYNPTRPGNECNYNLLNTVQGNRFPLGGRQCIYGLPNFIQSYFDIPVFTWDSICFRDVIHFRITNTANIDSVRWEFGDGGTSSMMDPVHLYPQPGTYTAVLTEFFNGKSYSDSLNVAILDLPHPNLGDTILLYSGSSINIHAGGGFSSYTWSTGSADSIINVDKGGNYSVRVQDAHCCFNSDTVYVKPFIYYAPSAFTPNGDGKNDIFRLVGLYRNIRISFYIFNRWGEMVFETEDLDKGWDGTAGGQPSPEGTYVWIAKIKFPDPDIITQNNIVLKGSVILMR